MRRIIPLLLPLALLAAGCRVESNLSAEIEADGSGVAGYEVGYDDEAAQLFAEYGEGADPFADNTLAALPGATRSEEDRGDLHFVTYTAEVDDIAAAVHQVTAGDERALVQDFEIAIGEGRVEVDGRGSLAAAVQAAEGLVSEEVLAQSLSANVILTLPGRILEHNATSAQGNTLTWEIPATGDGVEIHAASSLTVSEGGGLPTWATVAMAAAVIAAIGVVLVLGRKGGATPLPPPPELPSA